jgi:hypothetical protein
MSALTGYPADEMPAERAAWEGKSWDGQNYVQITKVHYKFKSIIRRKK